MVKTNKSKIGCTGLGEDLKPEVQRSEIKERKTDAGGRTNSCCGKKIGCWMRSKRGRERKRERVVVCVQCSVRGSGCECGLVGKIALAGT